MGVSWLEHLVWSHACRSGSLSMKRREWNMLSWHENVKFLPMERDPYLNSPFSLLEVRIAQSLVELDYRFIMYSRGSIPFPLSPAGEILNIDRRCTDDYFQLHPWVIPICQSSASILLGLSIYQDFLNVRNIEIKELCLTSRFEAMKNEDRIWVAYISTF